MVHLILGIVDNGIFDAKDYTIKMLLTNPFYYLNVMIPGIFFDFMSSQILSISQCCLLSVSKTPYHSMCFSHPHSSNVGT